MPLRLLVAALLALPFCLAAHADTFQQFALNATFSNGATITGTVDLDLSSTFTFDSFDSTADFGYSQDGDTFFFHGTNNEVGETGTFVNLIGFSFPGLEFYLYLPNEAPSFGDFAGGLCTLTNSPAGCAGASTMFFLGPIISSNSVAEGTFTAIAPAPEPSSLTLFATGLLGIAGVIQRRFATSVRSGSR